MASVFLVLSFIVTTAMLLPKGMEIMIAVTPILLFILSGEKGISMKEAQKLPKKPMIHALSLSFILLLYFLLNCFGRYSEVNSVIPMGLGLVFFLMSFPFTLKVASKETILPDYTPEEEDPGKTLRLRFFSIAVGFFTIAILSQSSPLYPLNNWSDANCFMTLGRAPLHGARIYSEVFDHKGPLLYLIHTLAAIISPDSFLGMYIIQSVFCAITHRFLIMTVRLFTKNDRITCALSVPLMFLIFSVNAYFYGDSTEELMLPFVIAGIYVFLKAFRKNEDPSAKDMVILGIGAAFAFWIKFTLCGFWIGAILFLIGWMLRKHQAKKLIRYALWFSVPCIAISVPILIYLAATSTLSDMFTVYFYNNMFGYQSLNGGISLPGKLPYSLILTILKLDANHVLAALIASAIIYFVSLKDKRYITFYSVTFVITAFFVFFGDSQMFYYIFALTPFALPGLIPWVLLVRRALVREKTTLACSAVLSFAFVAFCTYSFSVSCATFEILQDRKDLPSFHFAAYMDTSENVSILNFDFPDSGFYIAAESVPTEKYYCKYNLDPVLTESPESRISAVNEGRVEYVITKNHMYDFRLYELIDSADITEIDFDGEIGTDTYFLYRKKEAASS